MTRDDIIRMAREAGFNPVNYMGGNLEIFERFAALVAAAEREACARACEEMADERRRTDKHIWAALLTAAENIRARGQDPMPLFDDWPGGWKK